MLAAAVDRDPSTSSSSEWSLKAYRLEWGLLPAGRRFGHTDIFGLHFWHLNIKKTLSLVVCGQLLFQTVPHCYSWIKCPVTWTWACSGIPTHLRMALPRWGWPKPRSQSCRRQTSQWRPYVYSPGARGPCSSVCRHISPQLIDPCDSSCGTPPLWVCSMSGRWPGQGLQSRQQRGKYTEITMIVHTCCRNLKYVIYNICLMQTTLMWKSLSTKMFSGLMSLCMICLSVRYTIASKISAMILPLMDIGTET